MERAFAFGPRSALIGTLTEAVDTPLSDHQPGVILINAGLVHRIGPGRLYVEIARRLAARGFPAFRFDQSGIGDSMARRDDVAFEKRAQEEIVAAMDLMVAQGQCQTFVLMGICSGADNAHQVALSDPRVVGAVYLDGPAYRTVKFLVRHYGVRLFRPRSWAGLVARLLARISRTAGEQQEPTYVRELPPREQFGRELYNLAERGMSLLLIFTGGYQRYYNYEHQFADVFAPLAANAGLQNIFLSHCDHTFGLVEDRAAVIDIIADWMLNAFGATNDRPVAETLRQASGQV